MGELSGYFMKVIPLDTIPGVQDELIVIKFQSQSRVYFYGAAISRKDSLAFHSL